MLHRIEAEVAGLAEHYQSWHRIRVIMVEVTSRQHYAIETMSPTDLQRTMLDSAAGTAPSRRLFRCLGEFGPIRGVLGTLEGHCRPLRTSGRGFLGHSQPTRSSAQAPHARYLPSSLPDREQEGERQSSMLLSRIAAYSL
jgi:hypothetical protein